MTVAQMASLVGLTGTAARRHLLTLAHSGYVATGGKLFWLTPRLLLLALRTAPPFDQWLATQRLPTFTQHTITDAAQLSVQGAQIREQDWAVSEQQLDLHYRGFAVPLRDARGAVVAGLSVIMPMQGESQEAAVARVLGVLRDTAAMRNLI